MKSIRQKKIPSLMRRGGRRPGWLSIIIIVSILLIVSCQHKNKVVNVTLHCGAGLRIAADALIEEFEKNNDAKINANYAGSGRLLGQITAGNLGGLFMPGAEFYVDKAIEKGIAEKKSKQTVAYFVPVIFVQKGNPKNITNLNDFLRDDIRIGLGDDRVAAIGKRTLKIFEKNDIYYEKIIENIVVKTGTVNELGVAIETKTVDAVVLWDVTARQFANDGDIISIPSNQNLVSVVPIVLLKPTLEKELAKKFVEFCTSEKGKNILKENGYTSKLK